MGKLFGAFVSLFPGEKRLVALMAFMVFLAGFALSTEAQAQTRVLWWDVSANETNNRPDNRRRMAQYIDRFGGGGRYSVDYVYGPRGGSLARHMAANSGYRIIVITATNTGRVFNRADQDALRAFYASGRKTLMLDGTLGIRNSDARDRTKWPGANNSSANMLVNQIEALRRAGGGILIGTDHGRFQAAANTALRAILPQAGFSRVTDPSRDGEFFGDLLLANRPVRPLDILKHWESIPNQGQAPVGQFLDFQGNGVRLYTLVEASDKPGGGRRRPYISASINPGNERFDITRNEAPRQAPPPAPTPAPEPEPEPEPEVVDNMPTRKGPPTN